ncbi:MAG TPA: HAMP domain-containing protein [Firmicutes bacterium]|nr:HAMP domain-containing protein [Bacillota bacterium]
MGVSTIPSKTSRFRSIFPKRGNRTRSRGLGMKSIRAQLIIVMTVIIILAVGGVALINYRSAHAILSGEIENGALAALTATANRLNEWVGSRVNEVKTIARNPAMASMDWPTQEAYLKKAADGLWDYAAFLVADPSGNAHTTLGTTMNVSGADYFTRAMSGEANIGTPVINEVSGIADIPVAVPIKDDSDQVVGVLVGLVYSNALSSLTVDIYLAQMGSVFIVDRQGLILVHPIVDKVLKENVLSDPNPGFVKIAGEMIKGGYGKGHYRAQGRDMTFLYAGLPVPGWSLGLTIPTDVLGHSARKLLGYSIETMVIAILVTVAVIFFLTGTFTRSLTLVRDQLLEVAHGGADLTREIKLRSKDEAGELASAFNRFVAGLRDIVRQVADIAQRLASSSAQLAASAEESARATQQIASTVEQVARGAGEQSRSAHATAQAMDEFINAVSEIAKGAEIQATAASETAQVVEELVKGMQQAAVLLGQAAEAASKTDESALEGREAVGRVLSGMSGIAAAVSEASERVMRLGEQSQQIGSIIETIDDIAGRTNLLALNAAIEAARAGEHGRGFAVVADEVRKLAERSSRATKEIGGLLNSVRSGIDEAVKAMMAGVEGVKGGSRLAEDAGRALEAIIETSKRGQEGLKAVQAFADGLSESTQRAMAAVERISRISEMNRDSSMRMAETAGKVKKEIDNIASISEQSAAAAEEVSASTEEMSASVQEVAMATQNLTSMAGELRRIAEQFKV